ncbi:MAG TPA: spore germination protein GerPB [Bacillota bacterium]|nr:spore germination protein GerPB [Bacillota bacterium]
MNFFITQNIMIHSIKIDSLTNSSVFQIGTAGIIKPLSQLYNTGGFTKPAPSIPLPGQPEGTLPPSPSQVTPPVPFVPLVGPSA